MCGPPLCSSASQRLCGVEAAALLSKEERRQRFVMRKTSGGHLSGKGYTGDLSGGRERGREGEGVRLGWVFRDV